MLDTIAVGIIIVVAAAFLVYRYTSKKGGCSCGTGTCNGGKKPDSCGCCDK